MNNLYEQRMKAGLTQAELAARVGCNQATIYRIEKGAPCRPVLHRAILDALQCATHKADVAEQPAEPYGNADMLRREVESLRRQLAQSADVIASQARTIELMAAGGSAPARAGPAYGAGCGGEKHVPSAGKSKKEREA